jgi:hypothetical protein
MRFALRQNVGGVDVSVHLMTSKGVRVLEENWSDRTGALMPATDPGIWDVSLVVPSVLAPNDYIIGVSIASPYQSFVNEEVLAFRLWPRTDDRQDLSDRNRILQPPVAWRLESRAPLDHPLGDE